MVKCTWLWETVALNRKRKKVPSRIDRLNRAETSSALFHLESISEDSIYTPVTSSLVSFHTNSTTTGSSRSMWQVTTVPGKLSDALGALVRYAQQSFTIFFCLT